MKKIKVKTKLYLTKRILNSDYYISRCGKIISLRCTNPRVLKCGICDNKYLIAALRLNGDKQISVFPHKLVMRYFVGKRPRGLVINHKDFNKLNNDISNLEYVTQKQNSQHSVKYRRHAFGERINSAKLSRKNVLEIRKMHVIGVPISLITYAYQVSRSNIDSIVIRKTWRHI